MPFRANGSFGADGGPATTFTFSATVMAGHGRRERAGFEQLQGLVAALTRAGPGRLTWRIANAARSGAAIEAVFDLTESDAARLRTAMEGCLPAPGRARPRNPGTAG